MVVLTIEADKQEREFGEAMCHVTGSEINMDASVCVCRCPRRAPAPCPASSPATPDDRAYSHEDDDDEDEDQDQDLMSMRTPFDKIVSLLDESDKIYPNQLCSNSCTGRCCADQRCNMGHNGAHVLWHVSLNTTGGSTCPRSFSTTIKTSTYCTQTRGNGQTPESLSDAAYLRAESERNEHQIHSVTTTFYSFE